MVVTRLRLERVSRGLRQEELARLLGVSQGSVSLWERGIAVPRPEVAERLGALFGEPPIRLLAPVRRRGA